ncbi:hypothetical protein SAMN05216593_11276 [Pseudomonas asturiensis]|uniref:Uncharacterized protein n=1 Tax=Pseudomonas asturiensis TaxID=1190415 RepID=A0A1M7PPN2_9PSED|nr:hypothetical protein SAMN05216593_11276 [Pseudomonas asturiensis]
MTSICVRLAGVLLILLAVGVWCGSIYVSPYAAPYIAPYTEINPVRDILGIMRICSLTRKGSL